MAASLVALAGIVGLTAIGSPRRLVRAEHRAGGQLVGHPLKAGRIR
jgi:hypothetical protein